MVNRKLASEYFISPAVVMAAPTIRDTSDR